MAGSRAKPIPALPNSIARFGFDRRLFAVDVRASIAHCAGLAAAGVLNAEEANQITSALGQILERGLADNSYLNDPNAEDVHSFVEARLVEMLGDTGRKLHTGRSRNDQVATDLRLWLRDEIGRVNDSLRDAQSALVDLAVANQNVVLPGYTHLQSAQPVLLAHWCLAYFEMLARDRERLKDLSKRVNIMPLGSAALAGTSYPIDRASGSGSAWVSNQSRTTAWTRSAIVISAWSSPAPRQWSWCTSRGWPKTSFFTPQLSSVF